MAGNHLFVAGPLDDIRRIRRRRLRSWIVTIVLLAVFLGVFGFPYLRVTYSYKPLPGGNKYVTNGCYWSVTGRKYVVAGEYGNGSGGCPIIIFVPATEVAVDLWRYFTSSSSGANRNGPQENGY